VRDCRGLQSISPFGGPPFKFALDLRREAALLAGRNFVGWAASVRGLLEKWLELPLAGAGYRPGANRREVIMAKCETCGNDYDKAFQVSMAGTTHTFDSFECAIHALAPTCKTCGIRIVGHGLEKEGTFFCCEHCAEKAGITGLRDRVGAAA